MKLVKWILIFSAFLNFGFMTFDGARALIVGDYIRPESGAYAGQLGPWSTIVESVGIKPESNLMKGLFVFFGCCGLIAALGFARNLESAWKGMFILSIATLWYLVPGTILSISQIVLLLLLKWIK